MHKYQFPLFLTHNATVGATGNEENQRKHHRYVAVEWFWLCQLLTWSKDQRKPNTQPESCVAAVRRVMIDRMPRTREHVQLTISSDEKLIAGNNRASPYIPKRKIKSRSNTYNYLYSMESLLTKSLKIAGAVAAYW